MLIARFVIVAGLLALAGCSSPTDPGSDLAAGKLDSPSHGPGHGAPLTRPCQPAQCQIHLEFHSQRAPDATAKTGHAPSR